MKHGPIALIDKDMPSVVLALKDSVYEKMISNIQEINARGGRVIAIASEGDKEIEKLAEHVIYTPRTIPMLEPGFYGDSAAASGVSYRGASGV